MRCFSCKENEHLQTFNDVYRHNTNISGYFCEKCFSLVSFTESNEIIDLKYNKEIFISLTLGINKQVYYSDIIKKYKFEISETLYYNDDLKNNLDNIINKIIKLEGFI